MKSKPLNELKWIVYSKRGNKSLREIARITGISAPTLSRIERGKLPDIETFIKLCKWLKMSSDVLLKLKRYK